MSAGFTPGPWSVGPEGVIASRRPYEMPDGVGRITEWVAECIGKPRSFEETQANARLIAAAPELYEALEAAAAELFPRGVVLAGQRALVDQITTALAKARGEQ